MSGGVDAAAVLDCWFGELTDGFADSAHRRRWFNSTADDDAALRTRFGGLLEGATRGKLTAWTTEPLSTLAFIVLCDQFSRQIHRGTAAAFATDGVALDAAKALIERGDDQGLDIDHRVFVYMPFQHVESRLDQHTGVGLFSALRDATPADRRDLTEGFVDYARQHRDIVLRFGRFPHRNAVLGREATDAERTFLADGAPSFGQTPRG